MNVLRKWQFSRLKAVVFESSPGTISGQNWAPIREVPDRPVERVLKGGFRSDDGDLVVVESDLADDHLACQCLTFIWSSAARMPLASFTASSLAQKCMKKRRGSSSSMWL